MLAVGVVAVIQDFLRGLLEQVEQAEAVTHPTLLLVQPGEQTLAAVVEAVDIRLPLRLLKAEAQAAQASSSSNTQHLFKLHSHSKVLASGLHLLA
jgi:hypothetical protein